MFTYNCDTWAITSAVANTVSNRLNAFHTKQLRSLIGMTWPQNLLNASLYKYKHCNARPISALMKESCWRLSGHILRLPADTPAFKAMQHCFCKTIRKGPIWRGRPRITLPMALSANLSTSNQGRLQSPEDLQWLVELASDRLRWKNFFRAMM